MAKKTAKNPQGRGRYSGCTAQACATAREYIENFARHGDAIPSVSGLALLLKVTRETVYAWGRDEKNPEWAAVLDDLSKRQERELVNKGLTERFNPAITRLLLGQHGYRDKQEHTGPDGQPLNIVIKSYRDPE